MSGKPRGAQIKHMLRDEKTGHIHHIAPAALSSKGVPVTVTTIGNGVWSAENLVTGLIYRSGPTGAYSDTTATAAQIVSELGGYDRDSLHTSFEFEVVNQVAHACTLVAGTGVTLEGVTAISASKVREYRLVVTSSTTVTIYGVGEMTA